MVQGVEYDFFTIGQLGQAINRKPVTIRSWEDKGIIPKARYRHNKRRLYSRQQVEGLRTLCEKYNVLTFSSRPDIPIAFTEEAYQLWQTPLGSDSVSVLRNQGEAT